jgi:hypothetical protein
MRAMNERQYHAEMRHLRLDTIVGAVAIVWLLGFGLFAVAPPIAAMFAMFDHINTALAPR